MKPLELWAAVKLQTDDTPTAQMLALRLRDDCKAGVVEHETRQRAAPERRIVGYLGRAPASPRAPVRAVTAHYISAAAFVAWLTARRLEPSQRVRAWLIASGGTEPTRPDALSGGIARDEPPPPRTDALSALIARAEREAGAAGWQSVWAALVTMAKAASRPAPLLGYADGEIKYEGPDGSVKFFKREALRKRLERAEKRP